MIPDAQLTRRFAADLDALVAPGKKVGVAVSGGPDSLALLLLATAARPNLVEAATVDLRFGLEPVRSGDGGVDCDGWRSASS